MPLLSEIEFGAFLVYSPRGATQISIKSKNICYAVKQDAFFNTGSPPERVRVIPSLVRVLQGKIIGSALETFFHDRPVLVPVPRSSPIKPDSLYPTKLICQSMVGSGLGSEIQDLLERAVAVPKAAFSKPADRPTVPQHYASLRVTKELRQATVIVVVDDVVTTGAMLLASVSKLKDSFPTAEIRAFALIRTMSTGEIDDIVDSCRGTIRLRGDRAYRVP